MTNQEAFELSFHRPSNYFKLDGERQWDIDKSLGILDGDWSYIGLEDYTRFVNHYDFTPSQKAKMIEKKKKQLGD